MTNLAHVIEHAAHVLPAQGPITVFIHHNTLHACEDLTFFEGVRRGARIFGCQPFLSKERYREALGRGRIRFITLEAILREELGDRASEKLLRDCTLLDLRLAILQFQPWTGPTEELRWLMAESNALRRFSSDVSPVVRTQLISETRRWVMRDLRGGHESSRNSAGSRSRGKVPAGIAELLDQFGESGIENWSEKTFEAFTLHALWRVCSDGIARVPPNVPPEPPPLRHRDLLLQATGQDTDLLVNEFLIRFTAAYLDQGFSRWELPDRNMGYFHSFCSLYRQPAGPPDRWRKGLAAELARIQDGRMSPLDSIQESLDLLGVPEMEWEEYLSLTFLALRGWGGMVQQVESRADSVALPIPPGSLIGFLAIRLILDRFALTYLGGRELGYSGPLAALRDEAQRRIGRQEPSSVEQRTFQVFHLAQILGWAPNELLRLSTSRWSSLLAEIEGFSAFEQRRVFHLAYERRFRTQTLDALALHVPKVVEPPRPARFQLIACLDEREESFRRHLEEIAPDAQTFGVAGFFAVAMYYRGAGDAHFVPLCPIVIKPRHWVTEQVMDAHAETDRRRAKARRALGTASHQFHIGTRSFALGVLLSAILGVLASIPLIARILFPRFTSRVRSRVSQVVQAPSDTRLKLERQAPTPGPETEGLGFSLAEMTDIAERLLRDIGLVYDFSRLVFSIGHGSSSLNNPHRSAYDCGACGGSSGAPNGRAIAQILNDSRVRAGLADRDIDIPPTTWFVGGYHNSCNDSVTLFDFDRVPDSHRTELDAARLDLEATCDRNAHERCRRFMSAPLTLSFAAARQHVEGRSEDLAQTRPELGHATNAICFVGRRKWTRGLYFDRRTFLACYDPTQDGKAAPILTRTLSAVFPVCGGINLEYYFSHVDSPGYGCGTKLPHNVTSLLGVMDGAGSDLRTGLPWQMVEIHEPVRLLIVIETTVEIIRGIMERNPMIGNMSRKGWVQLALLHPETGAIQVYEYEADEFRAYQPQAEELPKAATSADWYRGWREHLEFAEIGG